MLEYVLYNTEDYELKPKKAYYEKELKRLEDALMIYEDRIVDIGKAIKVCKEKLDSY